MSMYTNTKKSKKFILILVLLMLFNFMYPKQVKAFDFAGNISSFFFLLERGAIKLVNDLFCDNTEEHKYKFDPKNSVIQVNMNAESIIKGKFVLLDANIFKEVEANSDYYDIGHDWMVNSKNTLRETIAGWYYNLLNFAIIALLSVLVYVGIRMITSTISQDKAKYKIMFKDWVVAICLLIAMHYIMIGILNVTTMITDAIGTSGGGGDQTARIMSIIYNINEETGGENCNEKECRYHLNGSCYTISDAFGQELLLLCIIILTFLFLWKYLKRMFTIVFLILLGPISCITYPIDKISDGKAQAFNKWFTEFIYNVLIQPFHLLLYLVLVGSATKIASENLIYALACLAMLIPAEKFVKEMFGFRDKLGSPLGAMAAGAAGGHLLSKMMKGGSSGGSGVGNNGTNTIKNKNIDQSLLTSGGSVAPQTTELPERDNSGTPQTTELPERDDGGAPQTTELPEGDDGGAPQTTELSEGNDDGAPQTTELPEGDDDGAPQTTELPEGDDDGAPQSSNTTESNPNSRTVGRTIKGFAGKVWEAHNQRATEKWGSAKHGQRWLNRGKKAGSMLLKGSIKGAGALTGGITSAMLGKGFIAGAATGWTLGGKAVDGVSNVVKDYADRMRTPDQIENKALKDFKANKAQIQKARQSFMERHEGRPPTAAEFDQEMNDRFAMARYGMKDDQIDDCIDLYQDIDTNTLETAALQNGISETDLDEMKNKAGGPDNLSNDKYRALLEKALSKKEGGQAAVERAKAISGSRTKNTANLAKRYSGKDFADPKAMANAYEDVYKGLIGDPNNPNCSPEVADMYARQYLSDAGKMHSVKNVALPPPLAIELPPQIVERNNAIGRLSSRGVSSPSEEQITQEILLHQRLIENEHFTESDIAKLSELSVNSGQDYNTIVNRVLKVKGEWQKGKAPNIDGIIGKNATTEKANKEIIERMKVEVDFDIKGENADLKIDAIRNFEKAAKVKKGQRELGSKHIKKELSNNDRNAMTDKDKIFASQYEKILKSSREDLNKYIENTKQI